MRPPDQHSLASGFHRRRHQRILREVIERSDHEAVPRGRYSVKSSVSVLLCLFIRFGRDSEEFANTADLREMLESLAARFPESDTFSQRLKLTRRAPILPERFAAIVRLPNFVLRCISNFCRHGSDRANEFINAKPDPGDMTFGSDEFRRRRALLDPLSAWSARTRLAPIALRALRRDHWNPVAGESEYLRAVRRLNLS